MSSHPPTARQLGNIRKKAARGDQAAIDFLAQMEAGVVHSSEQFDAIDDGQEEKVAESNPPGDHPSVEGQQQAILNSIGLANTNPIRMLGFGAGVQDLGSVTV